MITDGTTWRETCEKGIVTFHYDVEHIDHIGERSTNRNKTSYFRIGPIRPFWKENDKRNNTHSYV